MPTETVEVDLAAVTTEVVPASAPVTPAMSEVEEAAMKFSRLLPFVKKFALAANGKKSLARVIHALAEFPLGATKPKLLNDNERQLFQIMHEMNGYKTVILNEIIKSKMPQVNETNNVPSTGEGTINE